MFCQPFLLTLSGNLLNILHNVHLDHNYDTCNKTSVLAIVFNEIYLVNFNIVSFSHDDFEKILIKHNHNPHMSIMNVVLSIEVVSLPSVFNDVHLIDSYKASIKIIIFAQSFLMKYTWHVLILFHSHNGFEKNLIQYNLNQHKHCECL